MLENSAYAGLLLWLSVSLLIVLALLVISRLSSMLAFRQAQRWLTEHKTLIHEYKAATDLTPVEFGYLFDRKFRDNELLALLISMHQSKILNLQHHKGDLTIKLIADKEPLKGLSMVELEVVSFLKQQGGIYSWRSFSRDVKAGNVLHSRLERQVYQELEGKGYFLRGTLRNVSQRMRSIQLWTSVALSLAFVLFPLQQASRYSEQALGAGFASIDQLATGMLVLLIAVLFWPLWHFYAGAVIQIIYHGSGLPVGATKRLRSEWRKVYGYRIFLTVVEKNRINVDPNLNDPALPWCISVGVGPKPSKLQ